MKEDFELIFFLSRYLLRSFFLLFIFFAYSKGQATELTLHFGPSQTASGGSNPINIPPNIGELEIVWLTDKNKEISISIFPGIFYGLRKKASNNLYFSLGSGLVLDSHSIGFGGYSAVGYNFFVFSFGSLNIEYKQAIGISRYIIVNSYALRLGTTLYL